MARSVASLVLVLAPLAGCFLLVEFEDKPGASAGGGSSSSDASSTSNGTSAASGGGGGTGGGVPTCPSPGAVAGILTGPSVELRALASDGEKAWIAGVWDGGGSMAYRAMPGGGCAGEIALTGEAASSFVAQIDLSTLELDWWAHVASRAPASADIDVAVAGQTLYVAANIAAGSELLGVAQTSAGFGWAAVDRSRIQVDADGQATLPGAPTVCTGGDAAEVDIGAHTGGAVIVASALETSTLACEAPCGTTSPNSDHDAFLFHVGANGACAGGPHPIAPGHDEDGLDIVAFSPSAYLYGWRTADERKGRWGPLASSAVNTPPVFSPSSDDEFSQTIGDAAVGLSSVRVAGTEAYSVAATSLWQASHHRIEVWESVSGAPFEVASTTPADRDVYLGAASFDPSGALFLGGAVDERIPLSDVFTAALEPDEAIPGCQSLGPARACGDAYWVEIDPALMTASAGERWSRAGHQEVQRLAAFPSAVVVAGRFADGLIVGTTEAIGSGQGVFVASRPR